MLQKSGGGGGGGGGGGHPYIFQKGDFRFFHKQEGLGKISEVVEKNGEVSLIFILTNRL